MENYDTRPLLRRLLYLMNHSMMVGLRVDVTGLLGGAIETGISMHHLAIHGKKYSN